MAIYHGWIHEQKHLKQTHGCLFGHMLYLAHLWRISVCDLHKVLPTNHPCHQRPNFHHRIDDPRQDQLAVHHREATSKMRLWKIPQEARCWNYLPWLGSVLGQKQIHKYNYIYIYMYRVVYIYICIHYILKIMLIYIYIYLPTKLPSK